MLETNDQNVVCDEKGKILGPEKVVDELLVIRNIVKKLNELPIDSRARVLSYIYSLQGFLSK